MPRRLLRDSPWERIAPLIPGKASDSGRSVRDYREFLDAVLGIARTGAPWRDLPEAFGRWNSGCRRVRRWAFHGVFERVFQALSADADFDYVPIGGTIMRRLEPRHDLMGVSPLIADIECEALIAGRAYDSNDLRAE